MPCIFYMNYPKNRKKSNSKPICCVCSRGIFVVEKKTSQKINTKTQRNSVTTKASNKKTQTSRHYLSQEIINQQKKKQRVEQKSYDFEKKCKFSRQSEQFTSKNNINLRSFYSWLTTPAAHGYIESSHLTDLIPNNHNEIPEFAALFCDDIFITAKSMIFDYVVVFFRFSSSCCCRV